MKKTPHWKYHCSHVCIVLVYYPKLQSYGITKQGLVSFSDGPTSTMNRMWQEQQQHAHIRSCSRLCHVPPLPLFGINIVSLKHLIHSFVPVSHWSGRACTLPKPCTGTPKWNACIKKCNLLHRILKEFCMSFYMNVIMWVFRRQLHSILMAHWLSFAEVCYPLLSIERSTSRHCWRCAVMPAGKCARWSLGLSVKTKSPTLVWHSPSSKISLCPPWPWPPWPPWPPWLLQSCSNKANHNDTVCAFSTFSNEPIQTLDLFLIVQCSLRCFTVSALNINCLYCHSDHMSTTT